MTSQVNDPAPIFNDGRYNYKSPEFGTVFRRFCLILILDNNLLEGSEHREYYNVMAVTAKQAALVGRDRFKDRDYKYICIEDPNSKRTHSWDKEDLIWMTGKNGM